MSFFKKRYIFFLFILSSCGNKIEDTGHGLHHQVVDHIIVNSRDKYNLDSLQKLRLERDSTITSDSLKNLSLLKSKSFATAAKFNLKDKEYSYYAKSGFISQKLWIKFLSADSIKFNFESTSKDVASKKTLSGIATLPYPSSDPQSFSDEDLPSGEGYYSAPLYIYENKSDYLSIGIDTMSKSRAVCEYLYNSKKNRVHNLKKTLRRVNSVSGNQ